ncbi:MAG TPA: bifunctional 4-hydroxy-2-oxoglutarate aldolase/2-dehydro-3-deoxy-phosphogluconate aldolase [Cytophagales bacterium]|nr:bifunctional 4-hydroxy-2-oxoglutarate aldolase/2-dehydro-3-deoxy-phosphogluconate aldolase [Cytophagales bacterium]
MSAFSKIEILNKILDHPVVPVFYNSNLDITKRIVESCYNGGIRAFEFTNRGSEAFTVFSDLSKFVKSDFPDLSLGIGTIFTSSQAKLFYEAGADFIVQPVTSKEVGEFCQENKTLWAPGAGTVNEVYNATKLGADVVKLFPGNSLGPDFVKSLKGPMPGVKLMVTGGVDPTVESISKWFSAGVNAVGIGSQLFPKEYLERGEFAKLSEKIAQLMLSIKPGQSTVP